MDQQRWMDILACHDGHSVLNTVVGNFSVYDSDDDTDEQALFEVLRSRFKEIGKPNGTNASIPNCLVKPDPLIAVPPEAYRRRLTKMKRRQLFFKELQRRDILYLQVINTDDKESYKCVVLAKHGNLTQLDDLSIVAHFPKLRPELESIRGNLYKFDLIRGAFWSCSAWDRKLFVTFDTRIFSEQEKEQIPKLGRITRRELPYYVRSKKVGMTYAGYVQRSTGYREEGYCMKQLRESLGIDTNRIYSFFTEWDGKTYPASESFAELKKKLIPDASTKRLLKSFEYFRAGNMYKALHYANKAIRFNPDNIQARVTRGTVYANLGKMKKAFIDTEDSIKLDPNHESARRQMSELLVSASKTYICNGKFPQWHECLVLAKKYYPKNREVQELLSKSKLENFTPSANPIPVTSLPEVFAIYHRIFPPGAKRRLLKNYKKQRKRKRKQHRRRRAERRKTQQRAVVAQPIPTTTTTRRQVFARASSPVFRRPFPPRSVTLRR